MEGYPTAGVTRLGSILDPTELFFRKTFYEIIANKHIVDYTRSTMLHYYHLLPIRQPTFHWSIYITLTTSYDYIYSVGEIILSLPIGRSIYSIYLMSPIILVISIIVIILSTTSIS